MRHEFRRAGHPRRSRSTIASGASSTSSRSSRSCCPRRHSRCFSDADRRARGKSRRCAGRRSSKSAKTRSATPSLAGLEPTSRCLGRVGIAHRRDSKCRQIRWNRWRARGHRGRPCAPAVRFSSPQIDRSDPLHVGGANAFRRRLPGQPFACPPVSIRMRRTASKTSDGRTLAGRSGERGIHGSAVVRRARRRCVCRIRRASHRTGTDPGARGLDIGVVTAIAAPASLRVIQLKDGRSRRRCAHA